MSFFEPEPETPALRSSYEGATYAHNRQLYCVCGLLMKSWSVTLPTENNGKTFWRCRKYRNEPSRCSNFIWEDEREDIIKRIRRREDITAYLVNNNMANASRGTAAAAARPSGTNDHPIPGPELARPSTPTTSGHSSVDMFMTPLSEPMAEPDSGYETGTRRKRSFASEPLETADGSPCPKRHRNVRFEGVQPLNIPQAGPSNHFSRGKAVVLDLTVDEDEIPLVIQAGNERIRVPGVSIDGLKTFFDVAGKLRDAFGSGPRDK